jgi:hypothetical protein
MPVDIHDITIPVEIARILTLNDYLGFDELEQAAAAVLTHSDFFERWDLFQFNQFKDICALWDWKHATAAQYRIKQIDLKERD